MIFLRNTIFSAIFIAVVTFLLGISSMNAQKITDIVFISLKTNNIAYLDAFAKDTSFKLRITGTNISTLTLKTGTFVDGDLTIVNANAASSSTLKEIIVKFSRKGTKTFQPFNFNVKVNGQTKALSNFQDSWNNPPICQIYDNPILRVLTNTIKGIYDRPETKDNCNPLQTGLGSHITAENKYCLNSVPNPTQAAPIQEKTVTVAPINFTIKNDSYAPIFTPFKVQVKRGINVLKEFTINRLIAQEEKVIRYDRPEQRKIFVRHLNCPSCYEKLESPYNWLDDELTIVIDPDRDTGTTQSENSLKATIRASKP